jgi:peptidoglycan/LPS O-acetylase OafA/YrhL
MFEQFKNRPAQYHHAIDVLRAASVLYIVSYWHLFNYVQGFPGYANLYTLGLAYIILGTFTFTSGYLLAGRPMGIGVSEIAAFYRRRLVRIYPLYAAALLLFLWADLASKEIVFKGALLVSMFIPPAPLTLWFITMIMVFYLMAPALIHYANRPPVFVTLCATIVLLIVAFSIFINPIDLRILMYFPAFTLGIAIARHPEWRLWIQAKRGVIALLVIPALALFKTGNEASLVSVSALLPLILIGTLALFAYAERYTSNISYVWIHIISYSSFCMYLCHRLIYKNLVAIYLPTAPIVQWIYLLIFGLAITLPLSYLIQRGYDRGVAALEQAMLRRSPRYSSIR